MGVAKGGQKPEMSEARNSHGRGRGGGVGRGEINQGKLRRERGGGRGGYGDILWGIYIENSDRNALFLVINDFAGEALVGVWDASTAADTEATTYVNITTSNYNCHPRHLPRILSLLP